MKTIFKYSLGLLAVVMLLWGCKKSEPLPYESTNDVYFNWLAFLGNGLGVQYDSLKVNFALKGTALKYTIPFYIKLLGKSATVNRAFSLVVDPERSTAVEGIDYTLPEPSDSLFIPADSIGSGQLRVEILRRTDLKNKSFKLVLKLVPNENFQVNEELFYGSNYHVKTGGESMEILISDLLPKPPMWDDNMNVLGNFSRKKLELFAGRQGLPLQKFYYTTTQEGAPYDPKILASAAKSFQTYLNQQRQMGHEILEDDGTAMKMGTAAQ